MCVYMYVTMTKERRVSFPEGRSTWEELKEGKGREKMTQLYL